MVAAILAAYGAYVILFTMGVCWFWPDYVDCSEPPKVRKILFIIGFVLSFEEWLLYVGGVVPTWTFAVLQFCNVWGLFDAFLRFPIVHDLDSFFAAKQVFLILFKVTGYLLGFRSLTKHLAWVVLILLLNVCTVPIVWLTALPIGDVNSYHQKHDVTDQDLALRLWCALMVPSERAVAVAHIKGSVRKFLASAAIAVPMLKPIVLRMDPALVRVLRKAPAV
mmetsp:Transcript_2707/g.6360  ORF Transcript_2707/g.6360 Transcript_2707/m.6360 type:complete len:221 (+) Transcript_2707:36-698(+)